MPRTRILLLLLSSAALFTPAATSPVSACVGDCNEDDSVAINELILSTEIALRSRSVDLCPRADANDDEKVGINEVVLVVDNALHGCRTPPIPTSGPEMLAWLQAGSYLDWTRESALHVSRGPHGRQVVTYVNDPLLASLAAGNASHPSGSATVKELYDSGGERIGWAASVKAQDDSDGGLGWYWYEGFGTSIPFSGFGHPACIGCHGDDRSGLTSQDYVLTPYPLQ